jgi:hypothetical protein
MEQPTLLGASYRADTGFGGFDLSVNGNYQLSRKQQISPTSAVVDALARRFGPDRVALVSSRPQEKVDRLFAQYPPLATPLAEALGLRHDGSADGLVRAVLGEGA